MGKLIRKRKELVAKAKLAKATAAPAGDLVNRQGAKKAKAGKARVSEDDNSKVGSKRKRVKQESSEAELGLDGDQSDEEIGGNTSGDDDEDPMEAYQYPGPVLSSLRPSAKKAKIAKGTQTNDAITTTTDADIDG